MNLYEYQRSRSFTDLGARSLRFTFSDFFSLETTWLIEAKFFGAYSLHGTGEWKFVQMVQVTWPIRLPCPYMIKTLKKSSSLEPNSLWPRKLVCIIGWPWVDLNLFGEMWHISETIVVYDIKVGKFIQLNDYMNLYEYQRSRSFNDFRPRSLRFNIFKLLLLRNR